jgi:hypothetical protein
MKVADKDADLVRKIVLAINNSVYKKVTPMYLFKKGNLGNFDNKHFVEVLHKYFITKGYSGQDQANYFVPKENLEFSKPIPETPPEPEFRTDPRLTKEDKSGGWIREFENRQGNND